MVERTRQSGLNPDGKSGPCDPPAQPPKCPECNSTKTWKDGLRYPRGDGRPIQRYLCRSCGYRFSKPQVKLNVAGKPREGSNHILDSGYVHAVNLLPTQKRFNNPLFPFSENVGSQGSKPPLIPTARNHLNTSYPYSKDCRVCASEREAKNLVEVESRTEKRAAGATRTKLEELKGKIVEHSWWLKKQGFRESTIKVRATFLTILVRRGADLLDSESVKEVIAQQETWNETTKANVVCIYDTFLRMLGLTWAPPKYKVIEKLPFIPLETELNQLISGSNKKMAAFLQILKETGVRPGEAWKLKWIDINSKTNIVRVNAPEKYSNSRVFKVSSKLITMLNNLPRKNDWVFGGGNLKGFGATFLRIRKRLTHKLQNPRLSCISFKTFRHWKATMEYHRTKDILYVKQLLGHKNINNTLKYTQLVSFESDEFHVRVAKNVKEACELVEAGFEYVTGEYNDGGKVFRKRK